MPGRRGARPPVRSAATPQAPRRHPHRGAGDEPASATAISTTRRTSRCSRKSRGRRNRPMHMADLWAKDEFGDRWTHYWKTADQYSRIDYLFVSPALFREVVLAKSASIARPTGTTRAIIARSSPRSLRRIGNERTPRTAAVGRCCWARDGAADWAGDADQDWQAIVALDAGPRCPAPQCRGGRSDGGRASRPAGEGAARFSRRASAGCARLRGPAPARPAAPDSRGFRELRQSRVSKRSACSSDSTKPPRRSSAWNSILPRSPA